MPGDLVTAINGTPLDDPARGMEILQSMNAATQVTVTVERNGQSSQININNVAVAAEAAAAAAVLRRSGERGARGPTTTQRSDDESQAARSGCPEDGRRRAGRGAGAGRALGHAGQAQGAITRTTRTRTSARSSRPSAP